jgi:hypothetical protein
VLHDPDVVEVSAETAAEWSSSRRKKLKCPRWKHVSLTLSVFKPSFLFGVRGLFGDR